METTTIQTMSATELRKFVFDLIIRIKKLPVSLTHLYKSIVELEYILTSTTDEEITTSSYRTLIKYTAKHAYHIESLITETDELSKTENQSLTNVSANIRAKKVIRSKTNEGDYAKITLRLLEDEIGILEDALSIHKLVLTENFALYEKYGFKLLKQYNGKRLYLQVFSIKLSTIHTAAAWLNSHVALCY